MLRPSARRIAYVRRSQTKGTSIENGRASLDGCGLFAARMAAADAEAEAEPKPEPKLDWPLEQLLLPAQQTDRPTRRLQPPLIKVGIELSNFARCVSEDACLFLYMLLLLLLSVSLLL